MHKYSPERTEWRFCVRVSANVDEQRHINRQSDVFISADGDRAKPHSAGSSHSATFLLKAITPFCFSMRIRSLKWKHTGMRCGFATVDLDSVESCLRWLASVHRSLAHVEKRSQHKHVPGPRRPTSKTATPIARRLISSSALGLSPRSLFSCEV